MASTSVDASHLVARQLERFKKAYGIDVELRLVPWGRSWSLLMKALKERDLPDVFQLGSTWLATLAYLNLLSEVPKGVWDRPAIAPWIEETAYVGGRQWAVPWTVECNVLVVRVDLLDAAGLTPEQLSDWPLFLDACKQISLWFDQGKGNGDRALAGVLPLAVHCRPDTATLHWAAPWLWSGGWQIDLSPSANASVLGNASADMGFTYLSELCRVNPSLKEMANASAGRVISDFFVEGRYAFYTGQSAHVLRGFVPGPGERIASPWPLAVLPLPRGPAGSISRGGGSLLAVAQTSRQPRSAWKLVQYLTTDPSLSEWAESSGELPALECEYWQAKHQSEMRMSLFDILSKAKTYPSHRLWRTIESILMTGISEICWLFLEGSSYEEDARRIAQDVDGRIQALLQLGWGATA